MYFPPRREKQASLSVARTSHAFSVIELELKLAFVMLLQFGSFEKIASEFGRHCSEYGFLLLR